ncbi:MAG: hypothetical protein IKT68_03145 [Clostridia bacterium]|nr:hypothetical protein [Clostridia bacterium]
MSKNLKKKALLPVIAMVLVSVVALSSATYAWFTTGNDATISNLNVQVVAADGIQISVDGTNWTSSLDTAALSDIAAIQAAGYTGVVNQLPAGQVNPVSTAGNVVNGKMEMFTGTLDGTGNLTTSADVEVAGTNGNFIAFDLFFKMDSTKTIKLGYTGSQVIAGTTDSDAETAVRVAFIDLGNAATAANARSLNTAASTKIWEPNATVRSAAANAQFADANDGQKLTYNGVKEAGVNIGDSQKQQVETFTMTADTDILTLEKGYNKVRIYIWMEGEDLDCLNGTSGGVFNTTLKFIAPEA